MLEFLKAKVESGFRKRARDRDGQGLLSPCRECQRLISSEAVTCPHCRVIAPVLQHAVLADDICAHQVRAQTIYAHQIKAREVQGVIHQTQNVKISNGKSNIKAPQVTASVIYADSIQADSVVANEIYVRDLKRN
jgi:hypothetical protein